MKSASAVGKMEKNGKGSLNLAEWMVSIGIYIPAALLLYAITWHLIPYLGRTTEAEPILLWFICGGLGVFLPLIIAGALILKYEGHDYTGKTLRNRLRFRALTKNDILWSLAGLILAGGLSGAIMKALEAMPGEFNHTPPFMAFEPLVPGRYWLLLVWFPFWILNIMGEEFLWRGVVLPRQERAWGKYAWLMHATGWGVFHLAFGWQLLLTLVPLLLILSWVAQKTKNSWTAVIMHAGLNGPAFIAISLGWL